MKFAKILQDFFWTIPFFCFLIGYGLLHFLVVNTTISTPNFIGKNIHEVVKIASQKKLNIQIIAEKETHDLQPGTIVKQKPSHGKSIKNGQSIYVITTKQPTIPQAPNLLQKNINDLEPLCSKHKIKNRSYFIENNLPENKCFGQFPQPHEKVFSKKINTYIAKKSSLPYLFPHLTGQDLSAAIQFLQKNNLKFQVFYQREQLKPPFEYDMIITHQKPLAGSFVHLNDKLSIQLQVDDK